MPHSPRTATTFDELSRLKGLRKDAIPGRICVGLHTVTLTNEDAGGCVIGSVMFTRAEFAKVIDWYQKEQG